MVDEYRGSFDEYVYERRKRPSEERAIRREDIDFQRDDERPRQIIHSSSAATLHAEQPKIEPLKRIQPKIIGSLFDRLKFLEERITETKKNIQTRETIHQAILSDINADIGEKEEFIAQMTDMDDRRNLKMDISVLRREKRTESVQYWKDMVELNTELRELLEQHITEKRIVSMFKELDKQVDA